jgi:hypothetical protein
MSKFGVVLLEIEQVELDKWKERVRKEQPALHMTNL